MKLGLQLAVNLGAQVLVGIVTADVLVEQERVGEMVGELTIALDGDVYVYAGALVHHTEGDGICGTVLVSHNLLHVEEVDALVAARVATEGETAANLAEGLA